MARRTEDRTEAESRPPTGRESGRKPLHLNAFLMSTGHHEASWRLPGSPAEANADIEHYKNLARIAERGKLDSLFLADSPVLMGDPGRRPAAKLEPTVLLTALAGATRHIGLIATASTSYNEPYNLARRFASLDHVSGGRAGWNIVTTAGADAARNFGLDDTPLHADRYRRAGEFVEVSTKLWDSWADDAVIADKESGVHALAERVRRIDHTGEFFRVDGPLNVQRPPQGYPLLVQAGSSEDGKDFAARYAEAVFTAQQTLEEGITFYKDVKQRAQTLGRNPDGIKILPGIVPVIGDTEAQALELDAELDRLIVPEYAKRQLAQRLKIAPDDLDLDAELPRQHSHRGGDRGRQEPLHTHRGARTARAADRASAHRAARRRPRPPYLRRYGGAGREHHRALVRQRCRGRLQHHARRAPVRPGGLRGPGGADPPGTGPVPYRVHRLHTA
ncbi:NtaA/DmoA family FMN-dependent monooxygenase [Streptomyces sp. NBC_00269]|uniref:NtaA/DmoA family FMN-dependent monooxygenase n=1 Tax=Streptomyces sp. NBC_00269 TaxID=2975696 RepID=UPI002E27C64F|nr:NtaA/DmoA family FMN-dependent monooxygenase [Streptomyces sp. NBC_00269]